MIEYNIHRDLDTLAKYTVEQRQRLAERERAVADLKSNILTEMLEECIRDATGLGKASIYITMSGVEPILQVYMMEPTHTDLPHRIAKRFHTSFKKSKTGDGLVLEAAVSGWGMVRIIGYLTPGCELKRVTKMVEVQEWEVTCPSGDDDPTAA